MNHPMRNFINIGGALINPRWIEKIVFFKFDTEGYFRIYMRESISNKDVYTVEKGTPVFDRLHKWMKFHEEENVKCGKTD